MTSHHISKMSSKPCFVLPNTQNNVWLSISTIITKTSKSQLSLTANMQLTSCHIYFAVNIIHVLAYTCICMYVSILCFVFAPQMGMADMSAMDAMIYGDVEDDAELEAELLALQGQSSPKRASPKKSVCCYKQPCMRPSLSFYSWRHRTK